MNSRMIFDRKTKLIMFQEQWLAPTPQQWAYLSTMAAHPGWLYTREQLLVAGKNEASFDNTVDSQIKRVRIEFRKRGWDPKYVRTRWGEGYYWSPDMKPTFVDGLTSEDSDEEISEMRKAS